MKLTKIILTGVFATAMMCASFAATTIEDSTSIAKANKETTALALTEVDSKQDKREVKLALPSAVIEALKSEAYVSWKAEKAYEIEEDGETYYEIIVKKGVEQTSLYFNEEGMAIEK